MNRLFCLACSLALLACLVSPCRAKPPEPLPLIFDTDICGDCDDVLALAMIHAFQTRGDCRLLAVTVSADHELAAPLVNALNTFYGRGAIPIGVVGQGGYAAKSKYLDVVNQRDDGRYRYPHALESGKSAPTATSVLRKALASQPDDSVVIAQVGFSTNLARLLDSPADDVSPLSGLELVRRKVKLLSLMAGAVPTDRRQPQVPRIQCRDGRPECPHAGVAVAVAAGLERFRDRHRSAVSVAKHSARLWLRRASPGR